MVILLIVVFVALLLVWAASHNRLHRTIGGEVEVGGRCAVEFYRREPCEAYVPEPLHMFHPGGQGWPRWRQQTPTLSFFKETHELPYQRTEHAEWVDDPVEPPPPPKMYDYSVDIRPIGGLHLKDESGEGGRIREEILSLLADINRRIADQMEDKLNDAD